VQSASRGSCGLAKIVGIVPIDELTVLQQIIDEREVEIKKVPMHASSIATYNI
jgi:hypothetical protein